METNLNILGKEINKIKKQKQNLKIFQLQSPPNSKPSIVLNVKAILLLLDAKHGLKCEARET